ncbi:glycosyltransferase [Priestia megaterium]|uniref:glycosyltransferase n=1 Tax=Priestia megaterium TaxID=1404 RepID=UPI000BF3CAA3|nr:glycosyltransferase [Priestia megaterium]PFD99361.1 hypothetical protein CN265_12450 [Priestia megaterium]
MKLLVNATALDSRGGLSVLKSFLHDLNTHKNYLVKNGLKVEVLVSNYDLLKLRNDYINISYTSIPKKGILQKYFYENYILRKMIKNKNIDAYLSLQNTGINNLKIPQYLLIHQALPFAKLSITEIELKNYIKYKIVMNLMWKKTLSNISSVFVQSKWVEEAISQKYNVNDVKCIPPFINDVQKNIGSLSNSLIKALDNGGINLLYVTNDNKYKNIKNLVEAVKLYNENSDSQKVTLFLTTNGIDSKYIKYIGNIPYTSIMSLYQRVDALIFPSLAETIGLPIIEANKAGIDVLVSDLPFARNICNKEAIYFNPRSPKDICDKIKYYMDNKSCSIQREKDTYQGESYIEYISYIYEGRNEKYN